MNYRIVISLINKKKIYLGLRITIFWNCIVVKLLVLYSGTSFNAEKESIFKSFIKSTNLI